MWRGPGGRDSPLAPFFLPLNLIVMSTEKTYRNDTEDTIRLRLVNGDTIALPPGAEYNYRDAGYHIAATEFPLVGWLDNKGIPVKEPVL